MKKFLALLTALSLFAFAGSAFATSGTATPTAVTVTAGETTTVTVTGTATHGGDLSYSVTGDIPATLSDTTGESTTVTIAPAATVQANTYTVTVTVTEAYSEYDSAAGHTRPQTETATVDIAVTVNSLVTPLTFTVTPSATTIMAGETVNFTFSPTGGNGGTVFSLVETVENVFFDGATAYFTPKAAGTYTLMFTAVDSLGVGAVQVQTVTINVAEVLAATATLGKNPISVDEQVTITLTATGGIGASTFSTTRTDVTLGATSNNTATATFSSRESGIYALTFTATDTAKHTATAKVSVIVDALAPEPEPEDFIEEVVSEDVNETVTAKAYTLSGDMLKNVDAAEIAKKASEAIASDDSYTSEDKALLENIDLIISEATTLLFGGAENAEGITITLLEDAAEKTSDSDTKAGRSGSAPVLGFSVSSSTGGVAAFSIPRQVQRLWGLILRLIMEATGVDFNSSSLRFVFRAADDDYTDSTVFLDSNGNVTTTIPTSLDVHGNPRVGGFMSMLTYVEAGKNYDMILSIPVEELETAGIETTTKSVDVDIPTFSASGTSFFSTFVSSDLLTNTNYYRIGENALSSKLNDTVVRNDWARTEEERQLATDNNYTMITRLASIDATAEADTHTYIVAAVFSADQAKRARIDTTEEGGFIFYPNGPANAAGAAEVLKLVARDDGTYGFDDLTPADIKAGVKNGYLAFSVAGGEAATKPMLAVKLVAASTEFAFALSTSGITVQQGKTETLTITPENNSGDVDYVATEGSTTLDWITFEDNVATFAPTTSTAARNYTVTITGTDEANKVYSTDISVTVTAASGGDTTEALALTSSKSSLSVVLGDFETLQLSSNALGTATYSVSAEDDAGVELDASTGAAVITPKEIGTYSLVFTVTDSGRASGSNTATVTVPMTVKRGSVGSSSGGCDAGFGVLALAVLGGLIVARKK